MDLAVCGINCSFCKFFVEKVCLGCKMTNGKFSCPILHCVKNKGINHCAHCEDFPCETLYGSLCFCIKQVRTNLQNLLSVQSVIYTTPRGRKVCSLEKSKEALE